ncbi:helicase associated domain-containing protein [Streptomyces sp. NPDC000994]
MNPSRTGPGSLRNLPNPCGSCRASTPPGLLSRARREGLTAAQAFHDAHGHLDVPTDHIDTVGFEVGRFITTLRDAHNTGRLDADFTAELDALAMIWDKHQAAWRARLTAAADYHHPHGHLAAPSTTPTGAFLAEQRSLATHNRLDEAKAADHVLAYVGQLLGGRAARAAGAFDGEAAFGPLGSRTRCGPGPRGDRCPGPVT